VFWPKLPGVAGPDMNKIFLVGPLDDGPLLQSLLGQAPNRVPAVAPGYCLCSCREGRQVTYWPDDGENASGHVVELAQDRDEKLLEFFAAGLGLIGREIEVQVGSDPVDVLTFVDLPQGQCIAWDAQAWQDHWAPVLRRATLEVRDHFGQIDARELAARMPTILARAASFCAGQDGGGRDGQGPSRVDVKEHRRPYTGFFSFQEYDLSFERFDGKMGPILTRGVLVAQDAAILLPYDPVRDVVLLVEQFRIGHFGRGDANAWSLEPVAGIVDPGETPGQAAEREAREEAGVELDQLIPVGGGYPSPGNSTEYHHNFVGLCSLPQEAAVTSGLASENEDIKGHIFPAEELFQRAHAGKLENGPLNLLAFWLELNRARLRGNA